ncbi:MAG: SpoIID/LytB domain-containing protein [Candidatus Desulfacyla sp.]
MKIPTLLWLVCAILLPLTQLWAQDEDLQREQVARYDLNHASYLIEIGKYMEALENYDAAVEMTGREKTKIEALLGKATLLSMFLDAPEESLKVYRELYKSFPEAREIARYREGLLLFHLERTDEAREVLKDYLQQYPEGRFRFQAEALLEQTKIVVPPTPPTPPPPTPPTPPPAPPPAPPPDLKAPEIRVRLCKSVDALTIEGSPACISGMGCKERFQVTVQNGQIRINNTPIQEKEIVFEGEDPLLAQCGSKKKKVRGRLLVKVKDGRLMLLNIVDMEAYLKSVVPSESYASWPLETLKAQAVAGRTYAYYQILHRKTWDFDVVDDEGDQAYKGIQQETARTSQAVKETRGMLLLHQDKPILAMYSANSGGHTADAGAIFNLSKPYLKAQPDPESLKGKMAQWTKKHSVSEVEAGLKNRGVKVKGLQRIEAAERGPSGRIIKVRVVSSSGSVVVNTRTTLGRALKLPEILLEIKRDNGQFIFDGRGWGHGVGYSQWGSAIQGKTTSYDRILAFYYPSAMLTKKW